MPVVFGGGRTFAESLVLMNAADMFIAPTGTGVGLYKWLCNLPGLAFSNRSVLDDQSLTRWSPGVWRDSTYRHDLVPTVHLSNDLVTDWEIARGHMTRANFHVDWVDIYKAVSPGSGASQAS
jgi:hypothetical protein